jgi:hypothetical protein
MTIATDCLKYCKDLDNRVLVELKCELEHITENKEIYTLIPDLRTLKHYVTKELYARGLIKE